MILSGYLTADRVDRASTSGRLSARLAVIEARRRTAEQAVDALLEVWRTDPSGQHEAGWQEEDDAAHDVVDALSSLLGALELARQERRVRTVPAPRSAP